MPIATQTATAPRIEAANPYPKFVSTIAETPPANAKSEPTDKSMLPETITISIPTAKIPVTEVCGIRLDRFHGDRKIPLVCQ